MPTGYTHGIITGKGISFENFVMGCARAFGACVTMRDDSMDTPIPEEFELDGYHAKSLGQVKQKLVKLQKLTKKDWQKGAKKDFEDKMKDYKKAVAKSEMILQRYTAMLEKVKAWKIPSPEHQELKNFMMQQIEDSIKWDASAPEKPTMLTGADWYNIQLKSVMWDIRYHTEEHKKELERNLSKNTWVSQLRDSLKDAAK